MRSEVKSPLFSREARLEAGFLLRKLQEGQALELPHSRPMPAIGERCHELRIVVVNMTSRVIYRVDFDAIVIADVFGEKSQSTPNSVLGDRRGHCGSMTMRSSKRRRLEAKGWKVGSASEFLGLSHEEVAYVEIKLRLAQCLRDRRLRRRMTQLDLAKAIKSSQSRVAKMEAGESSVSLDLLVRTLLALGTSSSDLRRLLAPRRSAPAV